MFIHISCGSKDNEKECLANAKLVSLYARRFGLGLKKVVLSKKTNFLHCFHLSDSKREACLAGGGGKRRFQYCTDDSGTIV